MYQNYEKKGLRPKKKLKALFSDVRTVESYWIDGKNTISLKFRTKSGSMQGCLHVSEISMWNTYSPAAGAAVESEMNNEQLGKQKAPEKKRQIKTVVVDP